MSVLFRKRCSRSVALYVETGKMKEKQAMNVEKQIIALFCVMFDTEYSKWFAKEMNESIVIENLHYSLQPTFSFA